MLDWARSSYPRARAFRFTDTSTRTKPSTFWKAVAWSHSTMSVTLAKEVERFSYPRTRGMVLAVQIRNWFCCGSWCLRASTASFRPGEPRKELTRQQINAIALKYGQEFR